MKNIIIRTLPDINRYKALPEEYDDYGRFGMTHRGSFYCLGISTSHLPNTEIGGYWASNKQDNILYLSPRGSRVGFEEFVNELIESGKIKIIASKAGIKLK